MEWTSVEVRLPEDDLPRFSDRKQIRVLVTTNHKGKKFVVPATRIRWALSGGRYSEWQWAKGINHVTHWMKMPEPAE